jgi:hypothetical protein
VQVVSFVYNTIVKKRSLRGLCIGLIVILLLANQGVAAAQVERSRYFPETGHWVTGAFLEMYESVPNPEIVFGYPITEAFDSRLSPNPSGTLIQYFEQVRFELHPENPTDLRVTTTLLGEYFFDQDEFQPSNQNQASPYACRSIPEDGLPVCYAFLQYFDRHGGVAQFGYPLSELVTHAGRMVQYFQRARFEWHPGNPPGMKVVLSDLGREYFYAVNEDFGLMQPDSDWVLANPLQLRVSAFVNRAVMPPNGLQELYVVVQNQTLQPVPGAHVMLHLTLPSGKIHDFSMPLTNSNGISQVSFIIQDEPAGLVHAVVVVRTIELHVTTETSFRIWK